MKRLLTIGELLIDWIPSERGCALKDAAHFERAAGGAPGNVAAAFARLGGPASVIAKVGRAAFGDHIIETLEQAGVDSRWIFRTDKANTALAFVSLGADGTRDFSFYRNPSADLLLDEREITPAIFEDCGILHFGSVDLVDAPVKEAHRRAIELASSGGAIVSFDPNIRLMLWDSPKHCQDTVREFLIFADIVKISDDELEFITGTADPRSAASLLFAMNCRLFLYTKGSSGAEIYTPLHHVEIPAYPVRTVDTTGAGDAFTGAFLYELARRHICRFQLAKLDSELLRKAGEFACLCAAYVTTQKGAMPTRCTGSEKISLEE